MGDELQEKANAANVPHYSIGFWEFEGWWPAECVCGWDGGVYPSAEDACDALMDHARGVYRG